MSVRPKVIYYSDQPPDDSAFIIYLLVNALRSNRKTIARSSCS